MALYLHFLIIWNNNEFSTPAKNSDSVEVGGIVDQTEPLLSFMWTWKKESKCLRSERSTSQDVPQIPNSQRIFERMMAISSQFCFTTEHCLLLRELWMGWLYIHISVSVWKTHGHVQDRWFLGAWMAFWCFTAQGIGNYLSVIACPHLLVRFYNFVACTLSPRGSCIACILLTSVNLHLPCCESEC